VENWQMLNESIDKPCSTAPCVAPTRQARPTSPSWRWPHWKPANARLRHHQRRRGSWSFGGHVFRSHGDTALGPVDMHRSIVKSSNVYYYSLANELGVDAIHDFMKPLGFGQITGIDIQGEVRGVLPSQEWKRNYYKTC
jgi:penicillin-binding protein 2